jgi:hypothetical protein
MIQVYLPAHTDNIPTARGRSAARCRTHHHRRPGRPAPTSVGGEAVATVPRLRGKIPRIAVRPIQPIGLIDFCWEKLEAALGHFITDMARAAISLATNEFLKFAEAESSVGSMEDALKRLKHLRSAAHIFRAAIEERAVDDPTRGYVDDWLEMSYERLNPGDRANQYVANLSADLARFLDACDLTLQRLEEDARHNYWPEGGAWEDWIRKLTEILKKHHLPAGVRKDAAGYRVESASPFVKFVSTLQTFLPNKHVLGDKKSSLAQRIYNARKKPKPAVARRTKRPRAIGW